MWKKTVVRDQRANVTPPAQPPIKAATINSSTIQPTQNPTRQQDSLFKPDNFRSQAENEAVLSTPFSARKESGLSPWLYFWVPVDMFLGPQAKQCTSSALQQQVLDAGGLIVPIHELDRPYGQLKVSLHTLFDNIEYVSSLAHSSFVCIQTVLTCGSDSGLVRSIPRCTSSNRLYPATHKIVSRVPLANISINLQLAYLTLHDTQCKGQSMVPNIY